MWRMPIINDVGGGGEGVCRQTEEDLAEHSVSRHVDPRDVHDRKEWRAVGWHKENIVRSGTPR